MQQGSSVTCLAFLPALLSSSHPQDPTETDKNSDHLRKEYLFSKGLPVRQSVLPYPRYTRKKLSCTLPTLECNAVSYLKLCKPDVRGNKGTTNPAGYLESSNFRNDDSFMAMFIQKSEYSRNILHVCKRRFSKSAD